MSSGPNNKNDSLSNTNQEWIWKSFRKGKKWAFEKIYTHTYPDLYRFGLNFIQQPELVKDIIHDLFFNLWQKKRNLPTPRSIKAYLLGSLRSAIINHIKRDKKMSLAAPEHFVLPSSSVEEVFISNEKENTNRKIIFDELTRLTAKQKEAIYLHYILELSYQEVSEIMDIKIQSVRNLVHEGLVSLKAARDKYLK